MTPQERRGRRVFLILATVISLDRLVAIGLILSGGLNGVGSLFSVALSLAFVLAVAVLWRGQIWMRWLVSGYCVLPGVVMVLGAGWVFIQLAGASPPVREEVLSQLDGFRLGITGFYGLLYFLAGLVFLLSRSMRAFFRYQREGPRVLVESV